LSSSAIAENTSSMSVLRRVRANGIRSPSLSAPYDFCFFGGSSATNFSPSRLVCRNAALALSGSFTDLSIRSATRAVQPCSQIRSTLPTETSFTLTDASGTRSSTSSNSTVTRK
jgi:hypothetical protein